MICPPHARAPADTSRLCEPERAIFYWCFTAMEYANDDEADTQATRAGKSARYVVASIFIFTPTTNFMCAFHIWYRYTKLPWYRVALTHADILAGFDARSILPLSDILVNNTTKARKTISNNVSLSPRSFHVTISFLGSIILILLLRWLYLGQFYGWPKRNGTSAMHAQIRYSDLFDIVAFQADYGAIRLSINNKSKMTHVTTRVPAGEQIPLR